MTQEIDCYNKLREMLSIKSDWEYLVSDSTKGYDDALQHKTKDIRIAFYYRLDRTNCQIFININKENQKIIKDLGFLQDIRCDAETLKNILVGDIQSNILSEQVKTLLL